MNSPEKPMTPGAKIQPHSPVRCVAWNEKIQHILGSLFGLPSGTQAVVWDLRKNEPIIKIQDRSSRLSASSMCWNPSNPTQLRCPNQTYFSNKKFRSLETKTLPYLICDRFQYDTKLYQESQPRILKISKNFFAYDRKCAHVSFSENNPMRIIPILTYLNDFLTT